MAYWTTTEIETQLTNVRAAIAKAELAQSAQTGDSSVSRGSLAELYKREKYLLEQRESLQGQSIGGPFTYASFQRPGGRQ